MGVGGGVFSETKGRGEEMQQINFKHNNRFYVHTKSGNLEYESYTRINTIPACIEVAIRASINRFDRPLTEIEIQIAKDRPW
jgi:hypothetical protein